MSGDISELISLVQIENVRVVDASARTSIRPSEDPAVLEAKVGRDARVAQLPEDGVFIIRVDFTFSAHREDDRKPKTLPNAAIAVSVSFELTYRIPANMSAPEETLNEFGTENGIFNAWPYFREFVHASLARMGLPPFILPVYRLAQPKKTETKDKRESRDRAKALEPRRTELKLRQESRPKGTPTFERSLSIMRTTPM